MTAKALSLIMALVVRSIRVAAFSAINVDFGSKQSSFGTCQSQQQRQTLKSHRLSKSSSSTARYDSVQQEPSTTAPWATHALLISSFTDGVLQSPPAQEFLRQGLVTSLLSKRQQEAEHAVATSALQSPCCGPDLDALNDLETADEAVDAVQRNPGQVENVMEQLKGEELRFLYIPTAMYALRSDSNNTPGKQRQRARADGKKRRNMIVKHLNMLLPGVQTLTVTLDLDDGSIKQPDGSDDPSVFPKDGKEALQEWAPHFIYVEGGNTFWLYHCVEKGDWAQDIVDACTGPQAAVYGGKSAGAIIAGKRVETATWKGWDDPSVVPGMQNYSDWESVEGLGLVGDDSFFPHMSDDWETLVEEKRDTIVDSNVKCLREEAACCVDGRNKQYRLVYAPVPSENPVS